MNTCTHWVLVSTRCKQFFNKSNRFNALNCTANVLVRFSGRTINTHAWSYGVSRSFLFPCYVMCGDSSAPFPSPPLPPYTSIPFPLPKHKPPQPPPLSHDISQLTTRPYTPAHPPAPSLQPLQYNLVFELSDSNIGNDDDLINCFDSRNSSFLICISYGWNEQFADSILEQHLSLRRKLAP